MNLVFILSKRLGTRSFIGNLGALFVVVTTPYTGACVAGTIVGYLVGISPDVGRAAYRTPVEIGGYFFLAFVGGFLGLQVALGVLRGSKAAKVAVVLLPLSFPVTLVVEKYLPKRRSRFSIGDARGAQKRQVPYAFVGIEKGGLEKKLGAPHHEGGFPFAGSPENHKARGGRAEHAPRYGFYNRASV